MSDLMRAYLKEGSDSIVVINGVEINPSVFSSETMAWRLCKRDNFIQKTIETIASLEVGAHPRAAKMKLLKRLMNTQNDEYFWKSETSSEFTFGSEDPESFNAICEMVISANNNLPDNQVVMPDYENEYVQGYANQNIGKFSGETVKKKFLFTAYTSVRYERSEVIDVPVEATEKDLMAIHSDIEENLCGSEFERIDEGGWERDYGEVKDPDQ